MNPLEQLLALIAERRLFTKTIGLERKEFLKVGGSADQRVYFILNGVLRIYVCDGAEENTIRFGYRNNLVTALDSFITGRPSDLYIQAVKKTEVAVLEKQALMNLVNESPQNLNIWLHILELLVYQQLEREKDLLTASPAERYLRVLKRSPQLFQEVPHRYIANYLRMSAETLSRIKKS